jgi:hypothetical protein
MESLAGKINELQKSVETKIFYSCWDKYEFKKGYQPMMMSRNINTSRLLSSGL